MATGRNDRRRNDRRRTTGWIWAIVAIAAVGLVIWWIAAAVDNGQENQEVTEAPGAIEEGEQLGEDQEFGGVQQEEPILGEEEPEVLGRAPEEPEFGQGGQLAQFTQWTEQEIQAVDRQWVEQGTGLLEGSVQQVIAQANQAAAGLQPDQPTGGGPAQGPFEQPQIRKYHQELEQSIQQLEQARGEQQAEIFQKIAANMSNLLASMQQEAQIEGLDEQIRQLQQTVQQIETAQPLEGQRAELEAFFDQSASILEQVSQNIEQEARGGGPVEPQQQEGPADQPY